VFLPPQYDADRPSEAAFIPFRDDAAMSMGDTTSEPNGVYVIPLGVDLTNMYEAEMGRPFTETDLHSLLSRLPAVFARLEIAEQVEVESRARGVQVRITDHIFEATCLQHQGANHGSFCCPLCSSIALAITRSTNKPVTVDALRTSPGTNTLEISYRIGD
jgi:hypothetical protein